MDDNIDVVKIDDNTIEVTTTTPEVVTPEVVEKKRYDVKFLKEQKERVYKDYDDTVARHADELALRQAEKYEIDILLESLN